MSTVLLVRHRVEDFDAWKAGYDQAESVRRQGGVREHAVWRAPDDPSMVVVLHVFDDAQTARAMVESAELREVMGQLGVDLESVQVEFLDHVDSGTL